MSRYKISIDKMSNMKGVPFFEVYLQDKKTGRSGTISTTKTMSQARLYKRTLRSELR